MHQRQVNVQAKIFPMMKAKFARGYYRAETLAEVN